MNKIRRFEFKLAEFLISKVLENTISTIVITIVLTILLSKYFIPSVEFLSDLNIGIVAFLTIGIVGAYIVFRKDSVLYSASTSQKALETDWTNSEMRVGVPSTAASINGALYLRFMDIPFMSNYDLPRSYALEFKAKVLNHCFSWVLNATINKDVMEAYLIQYDPDTQILRPHLLMGFEKSNHTTIWMMPEPSNTPLSVVNNLDLKKRNGWYHIRTEVVSYPFQASTPDVHNPELKDLIPDYFDSAGKKITFDRSNSGVAIEIQIFDLNNYAKQFYHLVLTEPPFKYYAGNKFGFRNSQFEAAIYKDIRVIEMPGS